MNVQPVQLKIASPTSMSADDKFRAAVNVIKSLPKNGSYQPSYDLMLRFYAYYKQATVGACSDPQPAFWEVVKKKKWEAWNRLGNMSCDEAKENYVDELKKVWDHQIMPDIPIVETMSYTDNVAHFLESLGSFYETVPQEDLQLLVGNIMTKVCSRPGSRENSPQRLQIEAMGAAALEAINGLTPRHSANHTPSSDSEGEEEEFIDTMDPDTLVYSLQHNGGLSNGVLANGTNGHSDDAWHGRARGRAKDRNIPSILKASLNGHAVPVPEDASCLPKSQSSSSSKQVSPDTTSATLREHKTDGPATLNASPSPARFASWGHVNGDAGGARDPADVSEQLKITVQQLQRDIERVTARVRSLEVSSQPSEVRNQDQGSSSSWWPLSDLSPGTAAAVVLWPLVVHGAVVWWRSRKNR